MHILSGTQVRGKLPQFTLELSDTEDRKLAWHLLSDFREGANQITLSFFRTQTSCRNHNRNRSIPGADHRLARHLRDLSAVHRIWYDDNALGRHPEVLDQIGLDRLRYRNHSCSPVER